MDRRIVNRELLYIVNIFHDIYKAILFMSDEMTDAMRKKKIL